MIVNQNPKIYFTSQLQTDKSSVTNNNKPVSTSINAERFPKGLSLVHFTGKIMHDPDESALLKQDAIDQLKSALQGLKNEAPETLNKKNVKIAITLINEGIQYLQKTELSEKFFRNDAKKADFETNFENKINRAENLLEKALPFSQNKVENVVCYLPGSLHFIYQIARDEDGVSAYWYAAKDIGCSWQDHTNEF